MRDFLPMKLCKQTCSKGKGLKMKNLSQKYIKFFLILGAMLFSSPWAFAPIGEGKESVKPLKI